MYILRDCLNSDPLCASNWAALIFYVTWERVKDFTILEKVLRFKFVCQIFEVQVEVSTDQ